MHTYGIIDEGVVVMVWYGEGVGVRFGGFSCVFVEVWLGVFLSCILYT